MATGRLTVPDRLARLGDTYRDRNKSYGNNYKMFGKMMLGIFPDGVTLKSERDFTRFGVFVQMAAKFGRYGNSFKTGHPDSLDDLSVYSQMLLEVDCEQV